MSKRRKVKRWVVEAQLDWVKKGELTVEQIEDPRVRRKVEQRLQTEAKEKQKDVAAREEAIRTGFDQRVYSFIINGLLGSEWDDHHSMVGLKAIRDRRSDALEMADELLRDSGDFGEAVLNTVVKNGGRCSQKQGKAIAIGAAKIAAARLSRAGEPVE